MSQVKTLLICSLVSLISLNSPGATFLKAGDKAVEDGYLLSEYEAQRVKENLIDIKTLTKLNESYVKETDLLQKSLTYRSEQVKILLDEQNTIETRKYLYVAGGILATLITVYASTKVIQATK